MRPPSLGGGRNKADALRNRITGRDAPRMRRRSTTVLCAGRPISSAGE